MGITCITSVTFGLGKATAQRFIDEGWKVIGTGTAPTVLPSCRNVAENWVTRLWPSVQFSGRSAGDGGRALLA